MRLQFITQTGTVQVSDEQGSFVIEPRHVGAHSANSPGHFAITVFLGGQPFTYFTEETFLNEAAARNAMKHRPIEVAKNIDMLANRAVSAGVAFTV